MGVITQTIPLLPHPNHPSKISKTVASTSGPPNSITSMSQSFHQGIFSFSDGFERSVQQQQHIAQQSRRDKMRVQGFEAPATLVAIDDGGTSELPVYESGGMLSEMFAFRPGASSGSADLLENQMASNYRISRPTPATLGDWYAKQQLGGGDSRSSHTDANHSGIAQHQISGMNADSAAAIQLFLMNPPQARSPSPPPSSSTPLHMLLPNPSSPIQAFHAGGPAAFTNSPIPPSQFTWSAGENTAPDNSSSKIGGGVAENQGLSLSLSSSLQQLEAAKAAEGLRMEDGVFYYNQGGGPSSSSPSYPLKNLGHHPQQAHVNFGSLAVVNLAMVNVLRNSKYRRAAQELLEEFCSVGRGQLKSSRHGKHKTNGNPNPSGAGSGPSSASGAGGPQSSSSSKDPPPLSPSDRFEHQRRKSKLLAMHEEVERRYSHYCEQMQMVVNSFDSVMGFGAAAPYTALAQKAMSRHFRCLKDGIAAQLKHTCELLGEKDGSGTSGVTKGETPRLRLLEQSLRQQRQFNQIGLMDQETWRPQRGLPERSVNILRSWLFEHFLHPYPSDADKHLLARQTGLSRNQVSNWFINARVRLWKPMVEDMYQQERKDEEEDEEVGEEGERQQQQAELKDKQREAAAAQTPRSTPTPATAGAGKRSEINANDKDASGHAMNRQCFSENHVNGRDDSSNNNSDVGQMGMAHLGPDEPHGVMDDVCSRMTAANAFAAAAAVGSGPPFASSHVRFGTSTGDVSLTLGLRHAGNMPEKSRFSVGDFGGC